MNTNNKELLDILKSRINNSPNQELLNAKNALWEITQKRMKEFPINNLKEKIEAVFKNGDIPCAISVADVLASKFMPVKLIMATEVKPTLIGS